MVHYILYFILACVLFFCVYEFKKTTKNLITTIKEKDECIKELTYTINKLKKDTADLSEKNKHLNNLKQQNEHLNSLEQHVVNIVPKYLKTKELEFSFKLNYNEQHEISEDDRRNIFCDKFRQHLMEHFDDIVERKETLYPPDLDRTYYYRIKYIVLR